MATEKLAKKIFPITVFISDLPTSNILQTPPSTSGSENEPVRGRLVIIGDIHGMRKSFESLLGKISFNKENGDHLILAGDLVNKGPDSAGVLEIAQRLGASAVRGNHDNAVLHATAQINDKRDSLVKAGLIEPSIPGKILGEIEDFQKHVSAGGTDVEHSASTYIAAASLSKAQFEWLASLPLILRVGIPHELSSTLGENLIVVHAGLVPNIPLEQQDPHSIMHMRSFVAQSGPSDRREFVATEEFGEEGWAQTWDSWQERQESKTTVVFGHDAKRRLQLGKYSIGLDSACLYGHRLSALIISAVDGRIDHQVVQVECSDEPVVPTFVVESKPGDKF
ncbi:Metallo-dependent phosphatase [Penicillium citrinum]|uniref:Metallo-dependent phosphatase n=2 Tax=Penicillium TaxID=5073 RepID=A0A9W9NJE3_PENCI|nr:Metallo-dependent phosphatase [Penicillium citrinum]KAJ5221095.1 Metallo-dependent phosphatase [Penicillium citrinum]KAJ5596061.1 Metallo-dependent phosphatase [Penicillium hetheringtonii]KAK5798324.1 hypothetical protein VI817_004615 [Penicillium citrinum]